MGFPGGSDGKASVYNAGDLGSTEETRTKRDTCTPMFIAALFIIARTWKQPRCPSADEWIRKLWYIYTMAGPSVFPSGDPGVSGDFWGSQEGCR